MSSFSRTSQSSFDVHKPSLFISFEPLIVQSWGSRIDFLVFHYPFFHINLDTCNLLLWMWKNGFEMIICRRTGRNKGVINYSEKVTSILINLKKWGCMLLICNPCSNLPFTGPVAFLSSKYGKRAIKGLKKYSCSQNSTVLKGSMINRKIFNTRFDYRIWYLVSGETNKTCDFKSSKLWTVSPFNALSFKEVHVH